MKKFFGFMTSMVLSFAIVYTIFNKKPSVKREKTEEEKICEDLAAIGIKAVPVGCRMLKLEHTENEIAHFFRNCPYSIYKIIWDNASCRYYSVTNYILEYFNGY